MVKQAYNPTASRLNSDSLLRNRAVDFGPCDPCHSFTPEHIRPILNRGAPSTAHLAVLLLFSWLRRLAFDRSLSLERTVARPPTAIMSNNDNAMARFLFAILQQKCLKDVSSVPRRRW